MSRGAALSLSMWRSPRAIDAYCCDSIQSISAKRGGSSLTVLEAVAVLEASAKGVPIANSSRLRLPALCCQALRSARRSVCTRFRALVSGRPRPELMDPSEWDAGMAGSDGDWLPIETGSFHVQLAAHAPRVRRVDESVEL